MTEKKNKTTQEADNILEVSHLKKYFPIKGGMFGRQVGAVKAVDDVSFTLKRGTTMGLVGESGWGESTTGRTILSLHFFHNFADGFHLPHTGDHGIHDG